MREAVQVRYGYSTCPFTLMARIIGGIAASHTPTIGFAFDNNKQADPVWQPIFEAFEPAKRWLAERKPDVVITIFNDHITSFFFDHYSAFSLGVGPSFPVADEGGGARPLPALTGHPELAAHIGQSLVADEFDMSFFQGKALDHGCFSPMSVLFDAKEGWPTKMIPLQCGVLQAPIPSAKRCWKLGQALRRAIESYPEDLDVAIIATGGLSHQVHGERCGFNNTDWDREFLELFEQDPERIANMTLAELAELGGYEGAEVIMWMVMRGAMSARINKLHEAYYLPSMCGIAVAVYENLSTPAKGGQIARHSAHVIEQLAGLEKLNGTYPFDLKRSVDAYALNQFLHSLIQPEKRAAFKEDQAAVVAASGLPKEQQVAILERDWPGLLKMGAIFFVLEKLAALSGVPNPQVYAAMRHQSLEEFLRTRNTKATYSVAAPGKV